MSDDLKLSFIEQLKTKQNIIHKIYRLYTMIPMLIKIYFKKLPFSYGKPSQSFVAIVNFHVEMIAWHEIRLLPYIKKVRE
jgi:hypothetical protein